MILISLAIGGEVFAIAALWALSEWAVTARRRGWWWLALAWVACSLALEFHGLSSAGVHAERSRWVLTRLLDVALLPLFIGFPDAVCVAVGQSLVRSRVSVRTARVASLAIGALAVIVAPFAALIAGCGLAGACF